MIEQGPLSGQRLADKYLLEVLLGQGGFGVVYQAQHLLLNRQQAIKILLEQHFTSAKFRERFIREAQVLAKLDHPNIVHVDDFGLEGSRAYLVMPYISGGTLQSMLKAQRGPLGLNLTWRYLEQICGALDYAHARQVAHLDLKPLNLLMHEEGRLLLSDFGLAHLMEQGAVDGGTSLSFGTPSYMAPEHFDGQPEQRSDVYALGVILYQMLTGRLPFEASTPRAMMLKVLTEAPAPLRATRPELPPALDEVVGQALAKAPEQRYQKAGDLFADFQAALAGRQTQAFSSGQSLANAPTRRSQPPQDSTVWAANPPGTPSNPPGMPGAPTLRAERPPASSPITPSWPPIPPAVTPSGPQGAASNDQILRELEELKVAMRQLAQQPPPPPAGPYMPGRMPPPIYATPGIALPAKPAPRKAKVWSPGFIWLFVLTCIAGAVFAVFNPYYLTSLNLWLINGVLAITCLTGVFLTRSKLLRAALLLQIVSAVLLSMYPFGFNYFYYYHLVYLGLSPASSIYLNLLGIIIGSSSLICISYGIAKWRKPADLGLLILQIVLSITIAFFLSHFLPILLTFAFQAFSVLVFLLRPACWKQQPVITLLFVLASVSSFLVGLLSIYLLFSASFVLPIIAFLLLVRTEQVKQQQRQVALPAR